MDTLTTTGGTPVFGRLQPVRLRMPDLRGPLVALLVVALVTSVSALLPAGTPAEQERAENAGAAAAAAAATTASSSQLVQPGEVPEGLTATEWTDIQRQIAAAEAVEAVPAVVSNSSAGVFEASAAAALAAPQIVSSTTTARFQSTGAVVTAGADSSVTFHTTSVGDVAIGATAPVMVNGRAQYLHTSAITETYRDTPDGLQQLFTIAAPVTTDATTVIEVAVGAGTPTLVDPQTVRITTADGERLIYRDLIAWDATGVLLSAAMDVVDGAITLNVETADAKYPITIDPIITEDYPINLFPNASGDQSGAAVAIDVDALVIASPFDDDDGDDFGKVEAYDYDVGSGAITYNQAWYPASGDEEYGTSVDIESNIFVVGAPGDDGNGTDAGAVYTYTRTGPGQPWTGAGVVLACSTPGCNNALDGGGTAGDRFGESVALSDDGTKLVVGAPGANSGDGAVYVIDIGGGYTLDEQLIGSIGNVGGFGTSVDISSDGVLIGVGAPLTDYSGVADSGVAYVFTDTGVSYTETREINPSTYGTQPNGLFGTSVAIENSVPAYLVATEPGAGTYFVHDIADIVASGQDTGNVLQFGGFDTRVSAEGDFVVVGKPLDNDGDGAITILERTGAFTFSETTPALTGVDAGSAAGTSVSIGSNGSVAFGLPLYDNASVGTPTGPNQIDRGQTRVWDDVSSVSPNETSTLSFESTAGDQFGNTVALDGDRLAVSAPWADEPLRNSGAVYIFERPGPGSPWEFAAIIRSPSPETDGFFGESLDLLGDQLAVGEPDSLGDEAEPGRVWVFELQGLAWTQLGNEITPLGGGLAGNEFGYSVGFIDTDLVVIGSPGWSADTGRVWATAYTGAWQNPGLLTTNVGGDTNQPGDRVGHSVAGGIGPNGTFAVAGAPGDDEAPGDNAGAIYIYEDNGGGFNLGTNVQKIDQSGGGWLDFDGVGSAVNIDGDRIVAGGLGNYTSGQAFTGHAFEITFFGTPNTWGHVWEFRDTVPVTLGRAVNDYVDIDGGNIALGRPGGGGQVGVFLYDGVSWPAFPDDRLIPDLTVNGDRVGSTVAIEGSTLVTGASGDDPFGSPDEGSVFEVNDLRIASTWIGPSGEFWNDPGNWDTGVVPDVTDNAIIPESFSGTVVVDTSADSSLLYVGNLTTIEVLGSLYTTAAVGTGSMSVLGDATFAGDVDSLSLASYSGGSITFDTASSDVTLFDPQIFLQSGGGSSVSVIGGGTATMTSGTVLDLGTGTFLDVFDGSTLDIEANWVIDADVFVGAGSLINHSAFSGSLTPNGSYTFEIIGDSTSPANYGQVDWGSTLTSIGGTISESLNGYTPTATDSYDVVLCDVNGCDDGGVDATGPSLNAIFSPTDIILAGVTTDITVDTVDDTIAPGECSLRAAITAANLDAASGGCSAGSGADTIVFDPSLSGGTILLGGPLDPIDSELIIDGQGQDITISGQESTSIMSVDVGGSLDLLELTIADGEAQGCFVTETCGAVLNEGILNVAWVTFSGNNAGGGNGAAIANGPGGQLNVSYSTFVGNGAGQNGGAIWNDGNADIANSTFYGNFAGDGGAVYNHVTASATTVITNSTFSDNGAELSVLRNANAIAGSMVLRNTIVERPNPFIDDCAGTITADSFNIDTDGTCGSATTSSSLNLQPLADNGGPTQTVALGAGSAAFDAADLAVCLASPVFGVDQRGEVRPQGAGCDSGAYESNGTPAPAAITIDTLADDNTVNGNCTVREAILAANSDTAVDACPAGAGADTIAFDLPGAGPFPLSLTSPLPAITETVTIDGYSQPGASANTLAVGSDAVILIELDGSSAPGASGLDFTDAGSAGSVVQGLAINGFDGSGILAGPGARVRGNFIGTNVAGTASTPNGIGITVNSPASPAATIGGTAPGDRNVISGNSVRGIFVIADAGDVVGTTILGNYIGTDASGTAAVPNAGEGIWLGNSVSLVSGTVIGDGTAAGRNVVSGNSGEGIAPWTNSPNTTIRGNFVGVGADGVTPLGNALTACGFCFGGIVIRNSTSNNTVGGNLPGEGNLIANNSTGITAFSGVNNRFVGNSIFDNLGRGLEIGVVGPNDPGDGDFGANNGQNFPVITPIIEPGGNLVVDYSIDSTIGNSAYPIQIDVYEADSAVSGEGKTFLGRTTIGAPGFSSVDLGDAATLGVGLGDPLVATATDANGNTSNFSTVEFVTLFVPNAPSVAIDGEWAAVGVPENEAVYIMRRDAAGVWNDVQTIDGTGLTSFGSSLALGDPYLVIGSPDIGRVDYYERNGTTFNASFAQADVAGYGQSLDIDDGVLVIGSPFTNGGALGSGNAVVWDLPTSTLLVPGVVLGDAGDQIGHRVAIADGNVWLAAPFADPGGVVDAGVVYRFDYSGTLLDTITAPTPTAGQNFGWELDASGDRAVIHPAVSFDVYQFQVGAGLSLVDDTGGSTGFGNEMALSGDLLVVNDGGGAARRIYSDNGTEGTFVELLNTASFYIDVAADGGTIVSLDVTGGVITGGADIAVFEPSPIVAPDNKLLPEVGSAGDRFGTTVAIDGDLMAVSAPGFDTDNRNAGGVYVFKRVLGEWTEYSFLAGGDSTGAAIAVAGNLIALYGDNDDVIVYEDLGGGSVVTATAILGVTTRPENITIDGDTLVLGVPLRNADAGEVVVYQGGVLGWATDTPQVLEANGSKTESDRFGIAVDIDGNTLVGGAVPQPAGESGFVEVFTRTDSLSDFTYAFTLDEGVLDDGFGTAVAVEGDRIVVAAPNEDEVYVYDAMGVAVTGSPISGGVGTQFGFDLSLDSGVLVVTDSTDVVNSYHLEPTVTFVQTDVATDLETEAPVGSVATSDGTIVQGQLFEDQQGNDAGAAYTFGAPLPVPVPPDTVVAQPVVAGGQTGASVALFGDLLVIGAPGESAGAGAAYVFERSVPGTWTLKDRLDAGPEAQTGAAFGSAVAIQLASAGGRTRIAVGAPLEDIGASADAGALYIFESNNGGPVVLLGRVDAGADIQADARLGSAVGVPSQGSVVAGAPGFDIATAVDAGSVFAWELPASVPTFDQRFDAGADIGTVAEFGSSISVQARDMVVGAPGGVGRAYAYFYAGSVWNQQIALSGETGTGFGASVSIFGQVIAVGAPDGDVGGSPAGVVHLFGARQSPVYGPITVLDAGNSAIDLGTSVAIMDGVVVAGDPASGVGGAYATWSRIDDVWTFQGTTESNSISVGGEFGTALAVDGTDVFAGHPGLDLGPSVDAGGVQLLSAVQDEQLGRLTASDGQLNDRIGSAVAISGDTIVIGAERHEDMALPANSGAVYVYDRPAAGAEFIETVEITASDAGANDAFGTDVAIAGDVMVVGAPNADGTQTNQGAAYVFGRSAGVWTELAILTAASPNAGGLFGTSVHLEAVSATQWLAVIGAPEGTSSGAGGAAHVFLIEPFEAVPTFVEAARIDGTSAGVTLEVGDQFGFAVAADGIGRVAIGAPRDDDGATNAGAVYVFDTSATVAPLSYTLVDKVDPSLPGIDYLFGAVVDVEGDYLAVGAPQEDTNAGSSNFAGAGYGFELVAGNYVEQVRTATEFGTSGGNSWGSAVALSGDYLVVGVAGQDNYRLAGRVLRRSGSTWIPLEDLLFPDERQNAGVGRSVAVGDDGTVVTGAPTHDNLNGRDTGAAYVLQLPDIPIDGRIYAPDGAAGDFFGFSVDVHDDWMVVGARLGDGVVADTGSAYVFRRDTNTDEWLFVTELEASDGTAGQGFGWSVAIGGTRFDDDGDLGNYVIAVGAPDLAGPTDGAVYLYRYDFILDNWVETEKISAPPGADRFGSAVDLDQSSSAFRNGGYPLIVGAPASGATANGSAHLFRYTITENPSQSDSLTSLGTFDAPVPSNDGSFGFAVAIDGDRAIVGEPGADPAAVSSAGQSHVYRFGSSPGSIVFEATLQQPAADALPDEFFGWSVALDGALAVVGARGDDSPASAAGAAYVFTRSSGVWGAGNELQSDAPVVNGNFGADVRVEDGVVAVLASGGGVGDAGTVEVFGEDPSDGWVVTETFDWTGAQAGDEAAFDGLALGEDGTLVIGAPREDNTAGADAGAAQVLDVSVPLPGNKLTTAQDIDLARFGGDVDVDGEWAIVGAVGAGPTAVGSAFIFRKVAGEWQLFQELDDQFNPIGPGDDYGVAVAVGGDYAAIADQGDETSVYWFNGTSWVFSGDFFSPGFAATFEVDLDIDGDNDRLIVGYARAGAVTGQVDIFDLVPAGQPSANLVVEPGVSSGTYYGRKVAIQGDLAFASAERANGNDGSVVVFERSGTNWTEVQSIAPPGGAAQFFGADLDVDGNRLIVGQSVASRAWVFENIAGTWANPVELNSSGSQGGRAVSISGDVAVIGAPRSTVDGLWAGTADVFARAGSTWVLTDTVSAADREFGDAFGAVVSLDGSDLFVGVPYDTNIDGVIAGAAYVYVVEPPDFPEFGSFDFNAVTSPAVSIASTGFPADNVTTTLVNGDDSGDGSVSSTPLSSIDVDLPVGTDISASPVASLTLGDLPLLGDGLTAAGVASPLDSLPLTDLALAVPIPNTAPPEIGGWEYVLTQVANGSNPTLGTALLQRPLQNITFGEVKALDEVAALQLDEISVAGTPVASLPVASLVLGAVPVASLPTEAGQTTAETEEAWCDALAGTAVDCGPGGLNQDLTLFEITIAGVPVASLPVASLPVASLPVASLPVASLPVASLDLAASPVASLPVASLPVASLPVASLPVASLPVASLPVASLPVASLPTTGTDLDQFTNGGGTLASVPVASLYLQGVPVASLPVASLPVASLPVASLPVASLPVASLPVASLPVASLPVASLDLTTLDVSGTPVASLTTDGTLATLPVASLPVASLPVASLPVASLPVASLPVASLPVASLPVASLPVASLPVASLDVSGTPVASLTTDNTLATLPVASLPVASLPVASLPVASLPVASLSAVVDCGSFDCADPDASLADALLAAPVAGATLADLVPLLGGIRWGDLLFAIGLDIDEFAAVVAGAQNNSGQPFTFADIINEGGGFDTLTLGELPDSVLELLVLGDIAEYLTGLRLSDLFILFDQGGVQLDPVAVEQAITAAKNALTNLLFGQLLTYDDLVLADLPDLNGLSLGQIAPHLTGVRFDDLLELFTPDLTSAQVEAALVTILENSLFLISDLDTSEMTIGDLLSGDDLGGLTLGDLLLEILAGDPNALDDITLGDLLLAFVSPTDYPWEDVAFDEVDTATLPGVVGSVAFETSFDITSTDRSQQVEVSVIAPGTASYLPGTATLDGEPLATEPVELADALVWKLTGLAPDTTHVLGFELQPTLDLGTSVISTEARIVGVGGTVTATSDVTVSQAFEINDTPPQATILAEDTLYLTHIPTADDVDYFQIEVDDGDRLIVNLSNLDADFDVLVYGRSEAAAIVPLVPPSGQTAGGVLKDPELELDGTTKVATEVVNDAPVAAGLPVVATGNRRGVASETVVTAPLEAGTVYVQVYGANGASSLQPAVLQARITQSDEIPPCSALTLPGGGVPGGPSSVPADANTLILVNQERLSALYPDSYQNVTGAGGELEQLVAFLNGPGAGLGIVPGVVNVDSIAGIGGLYGQWDANPCDPVLANNVVAAIAAEITQLRATRSIDHIMVIGGDDVIPMARVVDGTEISNEFDYRYTFGGNNAIAGSAWSSQLLTDEPYGDTAALELGDRFLYITDTALGRLVESPDEIAFQLDQFELSQGFLNPTTGLVVGYDFLDDGSEAIAADLLAAGLTVDDEYGTSTDPDDWSAQDLADKLFPATGTTPDIISLNAHFDHRRALPALGNLQGDESDLFQAQTVFDAAPGSLTGRVTFSMGCHSSLNVSDQTIGVLSDDFAQAFTQQGGIYVGNTGYGYGDTETVAYSERLMELFGEQLVNPILLQNLTAPTTAGQALQYAKNDFFAELGVVSVYDEKALMEATFYGIPFYRVGLDTVAAEPTPDNETVTDPVTGDQAVSLTVMPANSPVLGLDDGVKYVNFDDSGDPLEQKAPYNPAQPLEVVDVTVVDPADSELLGTVARGVLLVGMASDYFANDPVIVKPITDGSAIQPEPDVGEVLFPAKPAAIRTTEQPEGTRQSIALSTGQFRGSSTAGTQRLDERIDLVVYYSPESEDDFTAPTIRTVSSVIVGNQLTVSVDASDAGGSTGAGTDIDRIYVLVAPNPGTGPVEWIGLNLVRDTVTGTRWVGSIALPSGTNNVEFIVQAKDGAGNVGYATNKAGNFTDDTTPPPPPPPDLDVTVVPDGGAPPINGWYTDSVVVQVTYPGVQLTYQLGTGPITPLPATGVPITTQGQNVLKIIGVPGSGPIEQIIRIDTAPPTALVVSPTDGTIVAAGALGSANFVCQDPSLQTCSATLDGSPVSFGADLDALGLAEGEHTIIVTAVDAVGNTVTNSSTFTIESAQAPPTVVSIASPTTPQLISDGVGIAIEFDDPNNAADDYTMTVDWGNLNDDGAPGSSDTCVATSASATIGNPSCSIDTEPSAQANGTATAEFVYPRPGVYLITVTIEDSAGNSAALESKFVVVYDPGAGYVSGGGWYWSGNEAYDDGDRFGNLATFGYNARYEAGETVPSGRTKLRLIGEFFFTSTSYDYLIINDTVAVAEGVGKVDGQSGYRFRVQGIDNGWLDFFQITIWDDDTGEVLYDNGVLYDKGDLVLLGGIKIRS